ncbi:MAG: NCS2 family permease [Deltaproteobacteria bacterium]|nr:NCS2 family permease [Deltaproteobacteria bacterium]MBI2500428.1 NCS2 family permease [Deltaproteobacteria bacterium]
MKGILRRYFNLQEAGSSLRTEVLAGFTTFLTLAYIVFVNPTILKQTGMDGGALITATILSAVIGTLLMGIFAKQPFALAPGMGLNAYFAYTVVLGQGLPWQTALGAVFFSGIAFVLLSITKARLYIINSVPLSLKIAIAAGIGLFLTFIGLKNGGFITAHDVTLLTIGNLKSRDVIVSTAGLLVMTALLSRQMKGAILIGILVGTVLSIFLGIVKLPVAWISAPPSLAPLWMKMDLKAALALGPVAIIFTFLLVDFFDNMGTLIGLGKKAGMMDAKGNLNRMQQALITDGFAVITGACLGTSTVTTYIESAAGIQDGGRTGLTAIACAFFLFCLLFFSPIIAIIPASATAPALIVVGLMMAASIKELDMEDYTNALPTFLTVIMIPFTFSIARGIAIGFISYTLIKVLTGRWREVHWMMYLLSLALGLHLTI